MKTENLTSGYIAGAGVAAASLQGVDQDGCLGSPMTTWLCCIFTPAARVGLNSLRIDQILMVTGLKRTWLKGYCTFSMFLWWQLPCWSFRKCIFPSLSWGIYMVSWLFGWNEFPSRPFGGLLVSLWTVLNPGYATPWVGNTAHLLHRAARLNSYYNSGRFPDPSATR